MGTVHFGITSWDDLKRSARAAFKGEYQGEHIGFISLELMFKTLTPNRWQMLQAMMGQQQPTGIRELARKLDRDVKQVHTDAAALATAGVINRAEDGSVEFTGRRCEGVFSLAVQPSRQKQHASDSRLASPVDGL